MPLPLLIFVALPLVEIALFVTIGGAIGLWATLAIVIGTAIFGVWLLRRQGAQAMADVQRAFGDFSDPAAPLAHRALIVLAGALLIAPGFLTDTLGLLLLLRPVRGALLRRTGRRMGARVRSGFTVSPGHPEAHRYGRGVVIDADYVEEPEPGPRPPDVEPGRTGARRPSGWTRG